MASATMAVAGLGSSLLRSSHSKPLRGSFAVARSSGRQAVSPIRAAKLPQGVGSPKDEPKLPVSFWGFTENAEVWNSRASMIGIFGLLILEADMDQVVCKQILGGEIGYFHNHGLLAHYFKPLIMFLHKGLLQTLGIDVGKGLDLPL